MTLESSIEKTLRKRVMATGWLCLKFTSPGCTGVPDRILIGHPGRIVFVETKSAGKNLAPRQTYVRGQLEERGFLYLKVDRTEQIDDVIKAIKALT